MGMGGGRGRKEEGGGSEEGCVMAFWGAWTWTPLAITEFTTVD